MRSRLGWLWFLALMGTLPSFAEDDTDRPKRSSLEIGTMIGYHSNVFGRANLNGEPVPDATVSTAYVNGETGTQHLRFYFGALGTLYTGEADISDARRGWLGVIAKGRKARLAGEYLRSPTTVHVEDVGENSYELEAVQLRGRVGETKKVWIEGRYSREEWMFDPPESERDARVRSSDATFRFPITREMGIRTAYHRERKVADDFQYGYCGSGRSFALEAGPSRRIRLLARYRIQERHYEEAPPGSGNFNREDTIEDVTLDLHVEVGKNWGIRVEDSYRRAVSSRPDRSYDAILAKAGLFFIF